MARSIVSRKRRKLAQPVTKGIEVHLFEQMRKNLFSASGVMHAVATSLTSNTATDEYLLAAALDGARGIVDDAASQLEGRT